MAKWVHEGSARLTMLELKAATRNRLDWVYLTNEVIGLITTLTTGTNDVFAFTLPYPSGIDLTEKTIEVYNLEFILDDLEVISTDGSTDGLLIYLSMLDNEFAATFQGVPIDGRDNNLKAHFAGPYYVGQTHIVVVQGTIANDIEGFPVVIDQNVSYWPMLPLRLATPLNIQLVNVSQITSDAGASTSASFSGIEKFAMRYWYRVVNLTREEMTVRHPQLAWQQLGS